MTRLITLICVLLMLASPAMAEPEDEAAALAAELLPEYTFLDGAQFDQTAMLLLKDAEGREIFAGCVRDGDEWAVTLSTPFPEWTSVDLDTYHAGEGGIRVWMYLPEEYRAYDDSDWLGVSIDLLADDTWCVTVVNTGWDVIAFYRQSIYNDLGYEFFGDVPIPLDITRVDWALLPRSFHQAMELLDTSRWMMCAVRYAPIYQEPTEESPLLLLCDVRTSVIVHSNEADWVQIQLPGRDETGWMHIEYLLPGDYQKTWYDMWCEDGNTYGAKNIILDSSDPTVTWYTAAHDESTAAPFIVDHVEYVTQLGWCTGNCCCLIYSETLGTSGFVPMAQLPYTLE